MADTIKLASKGVLLAKVQAQLGVDPVPTPQANAIRVEDPKVEVAWKKLARKFSKPYMGADRQIIIGESVKVSFKTELKGSGVKGTAPEIGVLFRGCNFTETIVPATKVDYDPNTLLDSAEAITIYAYKDGILRKILDCRASGSLESKAGEYGYLNWEFTGIYAGPVDEANPAPTLNETHPPRFISANFSLGAYPAVIEMLKINFGLEIAKRSDANAATGIKQFIIKNRKMTANIDPEVVALATKNWESILTANTESPLSATFGSVDGNKIVISAPKCSLDDLKDSEREGIWTYDAPLVLLPDAGNDEVKFSFQ